MFTQFPPFSSFSVDDINKAKSFYTDVLGLDARISEMGVLEIQANGVMIMAYPKPDHVPASFTVLNFPVTEIDTAVDALLSKGISFEKYVEPIATDEKGICRTPGGPLIAWFRDPAGNILSVLQEKENVQQTYNAQQLFNDLDEVASRILETVSQLDEKEFNRVPFKDSWTAGQLISHVTKSNRGIAKAMDMKGVPAGRDADQGAGEIKNRFLDFTTKYKSPEFIKPSEDVYNKDALMKEFNLSVQHLESIRSKTDFSEMIELPPFGEITKLELFYFVLYHTQRHLHQLENICRELNKSATTSANP